MDPTSTEPAQSANTEKPAAGQNAAAPASGLDADMQRLIEAVSGLAEAGVRPMASALRVLADNVGTRQTSPRVRLHNLEQVSAEFISAAVRFAESLANLSLQAVGVAQPTQNAQNASTSPSLPSGKPGETLRLPMSVENPSDAPMRGLCFAPIELTSAEGASVPAACIRVEPASIDIAARDFEKLVAHVALPVDAAPGVYAGKLVLAGQASFSVPIRIRVQ